MTDPREARELVAQARLLRGLALALVRDEHRAEDLVQDTLVVALETGDEIVRNRPGWLRGVLRNLARMTARSDRRRRAREGLVRPREEAGPQDIALRLETQERLLRAVRELPEPCRSAIVSRYLDGRTTRAVAREHDVPESTVRTWIQRGLERLRRRLDREAGDRRAWLAVLLPVCAPGRTTGASMVVKGVALMSTKKLLAAALLLAVAGGIATLALRPGSDPRPEAPEGRSAVGPGRDGSPRSEPTPEPVSDGARGSEGVVRGSVNIAATLVVRADGHEVLRDDLEPGPFRIGHERRRGLHEIELSSPGRRPRTYLLTGVDVNLGEIEFTSSSAYGGRVLDGEGRPVAGARVELWNPGRRERLGISGETGETGAYRLDLCANASLAANATGASLNYVLLVRRGEASHGPVPATASGWRCEHDLVVDRLEAPRLRFVRGAEGGPVVGAVVTFYPGIREAARATRGRPLHRGVTDANGELEHPVNPILHHALVEVEEPGGARFQLTLSLKSRDAVHEVLLSPERTATLEALVVRDAEGAAVAGASMWLVGSWEEVPRPDDDRPAFLRGHGPGFGVQGISDGNGRVSWRLVRPDEGPARFVLHAWFVEHGDAEHFGFEWGSLDALSGPSGQVVTLRLSGAEVEPRWLLARVADGSSEVAPVPLSAHLVVRTGTGDLGGSRWVFGKRPVQGRDGEILWPVILDDSMLDLIEDRATVASARLTIETAGRCPRTLDLDPAALEAAWRHERPLEIRLPAASGRTRFRVLRPDGTASARALVTVVPTGADLSSSHARMTRMTCDEEGVAIHADLDPAADLAAFAIEPGTGRAGRVNAVPVGGETTIRLADPTEVAIRLRFDDGKRPGGRASASLRTDPLGLLPSLSAQSDQDGVLRLPPCVLSLYRLSIVAIDDSLNRAEGRGPVGVTHRLVLEGAGIRDDMVVVLPRIR